MGPYISRMVCTQSYIALLKAHIDSIPFSIHKLVSDVDLT